MNAAKSAGAALLGGSQRRARVPRCEDGFLINPSHGVCLLRSTNTTPKPTANQINRSSNGIFKQGRASGRNRESTCAARGRTYAGSWCECGECTVRGVVERIGSSLGLGSTCD